MQESVDLEPPLRAGASDARRMPHQARTSRRSCCDHAGSPQHRAAPDTDETARPIDASRRKYLEQFRGGFTCRGIARIAVLDRAAAARAPGRLIRATR